MKLGQLDHQNAGHPSLLLRLIETGNTLEDPDGGVLADHGSARERAISEARSIMSGDVLEGGLPLNSYIEVDDEHGNRVTCVQFKDVVRIVES